VGQVELSSPWAVMDWAVAGASGTGSGAVGAGPLSSAGGGDAFAKASGETWAGLGSIGSSGVGVSAGAGSVGLLNTSFMRISAASTPGANQ
jgi:hypothetical protein